MDLSALAADRARYSRARRGRHERGATLVECALVEAWARAVGQRVDIEADEAAAEISPAA